MSVLSPSELLILLAEPTRLRILNCLAAAPLFVSDLVSVLDLPQPTVSRHLTVLKKARVVRDTPIAQFVLYRLRVESGPIGRLVQAVLDGMGHDETMRLERHRALERSRAHGRGRFPAASGRGSTSHPDSGEERS
jgi:ArsR family transcriptional regulator